MGRNLNAILADLPPERKKRIDARYRAMKREIESLRELRLVAGKAQADIAASLDIKQPSVSKIETQADMYLSTLRRYVEAIGGELDLIVRLPRRRPLRLRNLGEIFDPEASRAARSANTASKR
jgi:DNA-binding CsgD family transcriptional regulator